MAKASGDGAAAGALVLLVEAGWRPAGVGRWRRGEVVTTAEKALAGLEPVTATVDITEGVDA